MQNKVDLITKIENLLQSIAEQNPSAALAITQDPWVQFFLQDYGINRFSAADATAQFGTAVNSADDDIPFSSFTLYCTTLRKIPDTDVFINYLSEIRTLLSAPLNTPVWVTPEEKTQVNARKTWTDMVSLTQQHNERYIKQHAVVAAVKQRLIALGVAANEVDTIYHACIDFLQNQCAIVITFDAQYLQSGAADHQLLNYWQCQTWHGPQYGNNREATEQGLFQHLDSSRRSLLDDQHARPRYGALVLLDDLLNLRYGQSVIVLRDVVKHNSLFVASDSLNALDSDDRNLMPCTYNCMEILLLELSDQRLSAIVQSVTTGPIFLGHSSYGDEYIEVLLPAIDLLSPEMVSAFSFAPQDAISAEDKEALTQRGICVTSHGKNFYSVLTKEIFTAFEQSDTQRLIQLLEQFSQLVPFIFDSNGYNLIHRAICAASQSDQYQHLLNLLLDKNFNLNSLTRNGETSLTIEVRQGDIAAIQFILTLPGIDVNQKTRLGETALCVAVKQGNLAIAKILLNCPGIESNVARLGDGKTIAQIARAHGHCAIVEYLEHYHKEKLQRTYSTPCNEQPKHDDDAETTMWPQNITHKMQLLGHQYQFDTSAFMQAIADLDIFSAQLPLSDKTHIEQRAADLINAFEVFCAAYTANPSSTALEFISDATENYNFYLNTDSGHLIYKSTFLTIGVVLGSIIVGIALTAVLAVCVDSLVQLVNKGAELFSASAFADFFVSAFHSVLHPLFHGSGITEITPMLIGAAAGGGGGLVASLSAAAYALLGKPYGYQSLGLFRDKNFYVAQSADTVNQIVEQVKTCHAENNIITQNDSDSLYQNNSVADFSVT